MHLRESVELHYSVFLLHWANVWQFFEAQSGIQTGKWPLKLVVFAVVIIKRGSRRWFSLIVLLSEVSLGNCRWRRGHCTCFTCVQ